MDAQAVNMQPTEGWERGSESLTTRCGFRFTLRRAHPDDLPELKIFLGQLTSADLRFRFLSPMRSVSDDLVKDLLREDRAIEHYLAYEPGESAIIASGMLAIDASGKKAEVALCIRPEFKHEGISWTMLEFLLAQARAKGVESVEAIEARDHREAIALEREMGFESDRSCADPSVVVVRKSFSDAT